MHTRRVIVQRTHANEINIKPQSIIYEAGNIFIESVFREIRARIQWAALNSIF